MAVPIASAYHIYRTPGPRQTDWQCDAADGNDETIAEGYGRTPALAMKDCISSMIRSARQKKTRSL